MIVAVSAAFIMMGGWVLMKDGKGRAADDWDQSERYIAGENVQLRLEVDRLRQRLEEVDDYRRRAELMAERLSQKVQYLKEQLIQEQNITAADRTLFGPWGGGITIDGKTTTPAERDAILGTFSDIKQPDRLILI